jgi:hypothetical protein
VALAPDVAGRDGGGNVREVVDRLLGVARRRARGAGGARRVGQAAAVRRV